MLKKLFFIALLAFLVMHLGCAHKTKSTRVGFPQAGEETGLKGQAAETGAPGEDELSEAKNQLARELDFSHRNGELPTLYFAYDSAALTSLSQTSLEAVADWLKKNPNARVRIEGHCDERGTTEYNLALGERRALAAERYLLSVGVDPARIFRISYGKEKPAVQGHDESAWQLNRRDEFLISM